MHDRPAHRIRRRAGATLRCKEPVASRATDPDTEVAHIFDHDIAGDRRIAASPSAAAGARVAIDRSDIDLRRLAKALVPFRTPDDGRAAFELAITLVPLVMLWIAAVLLVRAGLWAGLLLTLPAGGMLLRLFLIQHDCGHGSFFRRRALNRWIGRAIGVLTLTPYEFWRRSHAAHHAGTGNLDRRGLGDIDTLTLAEYRRLSPARRWGYRLYRSPPVLFGIGPAYQFLFRHRFPAGQVRDGWPVWRGVLATDAAIVLLGAGLAWTVGLVPFLLVQLPVTLVAATAGMWLFYIQHQFPHALWRRDADWSFHEAALHGSSYYDLPTPLRWISADIGVHHVHHLCSTIPFYRMQAVLRAVPALTGIGRLGLMESFATVRLVLWDEAAGRMVSFRDAHPARARGGGAVRETRALLRRRRAAA